MRFLIMLCFILTSCGKDKPQASQDDCSVYERTEPIHEDFIDIISEFENDGRRFNCQFSVEDITIKYGTTGFVSCVDGEIIVNSFIYPLVSYVNKKTAFYRALGVCVLGREISNKEYNGKQASLMDDEVLRDILFISLEDEYIKELFLNDSRDLEAQLDKF